MNVYLNENISSSNKITKTQNTSFPVSHLMNPHVSEEPLLVPPRHDAAKALLDAKPVHPVQDLLDGLVVSRLCSQVIQLPDVYYFGQDLRQARRKSTGDYKYSKYCIVL